MVILENMTGKMFSVTTLLVISGILFGLSQCQLKENREWEKFKTKHITSQTVAAFNCNRTMNDPLYTPDGQCKSANTFIHSTTGTIKEICRNVAGPVNKSSKQKFPLTTCTKTIRCEYSQSNQTNFICVTCKANLPIHFFKIGTC
ncbi:Amphinase-1 [Aquarana catesbeiana]|uniref:Amphinase-1 n=1 Tax=Aquarana catesbeiana TaxID=8400 RepID=A0A2G9S8L3_AQUCT|nr:Amphinase-1 [Aquarana catesbeiana]